MFSQGYLLRLARLQQLRQQTGETQLLPVTICKGPCKRMQHCWAQHVASVCMKPQQCWHLLALVTYSLKPVKFLGPCKRTQHCWPKTSNNTQQCCDLMRKFWSLDKYCERVIVAVTSFFFSEEKASESLTGIESITL